MPEQKPVVVARSADLKASNAWVQLPQCEEIFTDDAAGCRRAAARQRA